VKCSRRQEFVIGGWTPSEKRNGFKSLLVGTWEEGKLVYQGRVGTGFNDKDLQDLSARFDKLARTDPPFDKIPRELRRSRWLEPKLVAEIDFAEFTADGILRHPSFKGLREDKKPKDVHLEKAARKPVAKKGVMTVGTAGDGDDTARAGVRITSPEKVLYPRQGLTKRDLLDYYEAIAPVMLPHLKGRPLSLVRCPQGQGHKCFYQKHDSGGFPAELRRVMITEGSGETRSISISTICPAWSPACRWGCSSSISGDRGSTSLRSRTASSSTSIPTRASASRMSAAPRSTCATGCRRSGSPRFRCSPAARAFTWLRR
jgi:bifunctional non-homologous end joining protein LigD